MMERLLHGSAIYRSVVCTNESPRNAEDEKSVVQHLTGPVRLPPEQDQVHQGLKAVDSDREVVGETFQRELLGMNLSQVKVLEVEPVDHSEGEYVGNLSKQ